MSKFGENLRALRVEQAITQTKLAELLNTTQDTISLWELGKSYPDLEALVKISIHFKTSTDYLLGLKDYEEF